MIESFHVKTKVGILNNLELIQNNSIVLWTKSKNDNVIFNNILVNLQNENPIKTTHICADTTPVYFFSNLSATCWNMV